MSLVWSARRPSLVPVAGGVCEGEVRAGAVGDADGNQMAGFVRVRGGLVVFPKPVKPRRQPVLAEPGKLRAFFAEVGLVVRCFWRHEPEARKVCRSAHEWVVDKQEIAY